VSDIFQEVDEEVRREQYKKLWDRYQNYVIAGVILIVVAVGGWRGYEWYEGKKAAEYGTLFEEAVTLAESGKHEEAEALFAKIAREGTSGYRGLARLREAAALAERDPKAGLAAYEKIAADTSVDATLRDLAALRAGALLIDAGSFTEARARLEPLAAGKRPFRHTARELLALAAWRAGDTVAAKRWSDLIMTDAETPASTRSRIEMLVELVAAESKG
jgi:hypothetical protein